MKRRKFIKNSLLTAIGTSLVATNVNSHDSDGIKEGKELVSHNLKYERFTKSRSYIVEVVNIHLDYYKYSDTNVFNVNKESLFPFSLEQGDYAVLLKPMSKGFVKTHLFELTRKGYQLVGENISLGKDSTMSWPALGIEVNITNL